MDSLRRAGDSCGARIEVMAESVPVGWGEPLYDKLDADIAWAMMGINAVKGVEIGAGFRSVSQRGSEHGDELTPAGFWVMRRAASWGHFNRPTDHGVHCHQAHVQHPRATPVDR